MSMNVFYKALSHTLNIEGGFVDDPSDSGGKTNLGITERLARKHGYRGRMQDLPRPTAINIYHDAFWSRMHLDDVAAQSEEVAVELFDSAVNVGVWRCSEWFQRLLNALNNRESLYPDIVVDGIVGPRTLSTWRAYFSHRGTEGADVFRRGINAMQGAFYVSLAERRQKDERFLYGWLRTRV